MLRFEEWDQGNKILLGGPMIVAKWVSVFHLFFLLVLFGLPQDVCVFQGTLEDKDVSADI